MAIYKNKDIEVNINERTVEIGNINVNFYTEDNGTASIRIKIKNQQGIPINFNNTDMLPRLDLYAADESVFTNEPVDIILPEQGLIHYKVSNNAIRHEGKMKCKLFLENETNSVHVANFYFVIKDSGVKGLVDKEVKIPFVEETIQKLISENVDVIFGADFKDQVINNLIEYANTKPALFKSEVNVKDSGKIPLTLNEGTTDNQQIYNDITHYRVIEIGSIKQVIVYGNVKNLTGTSAYIADLPSNIAPTKTIRLPAGLDLTDREMISAQVLLTGKVTLVKQNVFKPEYPVEFYFSYYI
ncbi:BppU family phage baseplate upper protein [Staphylococcus cohnii]|uniref:BppU family phage baseplate upper protein n=1 Tax=Staphylococcus cohnii TaxID=29382 RepID=A0ABT6J0C1_9STAP|nr:BppU family phage baseplate upper protein [Staphylococcus cohnii]MDH5140091.1 BppU family phage baseplate upper protein [Staphylococcus cohnii]MDH5157975.1 BppU family phage baseplate upper protein [Staphylococcus cohnii]MDH5169598.1 BppU family phage baseplate upper protein [Staphylococcus cohnii]